MTDFNKWHPDRRTVPKGPTPLMRAWLLRGAWYASTLMLIAGYVLMFVFWNR